MISSRFFIGLSLLVAGGTGIASAQKASPLFTLYSDMCLHAESGDALGYRIGLIRLRDATYVYFQGSGGWFQKPQIIALDGRLRGLKLEFEIEDSSGPKQSFQGTVSAAAIDGKIRIPRRDGGFNEEKLHLRKAVENDQNFPQCK